MQAQFGGMGDDRHPAARGVLPRITRQVRMSREQIAQCLDVVMSSGVKHLADEHELGPARCVIAASQHQLRVGKRGVGEIESWRMMCTEVIDRCGIPIAKRAQEILGLVAELIEIRTGRELTDGHVEPPLDARGPHAPGEGGSNRTLATVAGSGGLGPARGREASCTPGHDHSTAADGWQSHLERLAQATRTRLRIVIEPHAAH